VDLYFLRLAALLSDALKTDKEIRQLKSALADHLSDRQRERRERLGLRFKRHDQAQAREQASAWMLDG